MSKTVADILVSTLEQVGVKHVFGLIGDSLNPFADSIRRSSIEWVGVRHEEGGAMAAAAQGKLTGGLGVCCGTTGPGSTHMVSGLYEASRDHAPVLAISGDMARKFQGTDYIQTTKPDLLFRDVSLYTETIMSAEQAPRVIHQAISASFSGRGVSHLTLPIDIMEMKASGEVESVETLKRRGDIIPTDAAMQEVVQHINKAERIVIMCGNGCHGLADQLRELSDKLKAPLIHSVKGKDIMPYSDPHWMGGIGMIGTKAVYHAVKHCDLFLMIGTDYPYSEFLPEKSVAIQIDERPEVLGRRAPTLLGVIGSAAPSVNYLVKNVGSKTSADFFNKVTEERKKWDEMIDKQADLGRSKDLIHPQAVARTVGELADDNAVFVFETGLNTLWSGNWIRQKGTQRIIGSFNNAAIGAGMAQANGIQALDRKRQVIAMCGDGGFNMLMCEFMTAVQHKLPVKVIIYNNSCFGLITLEAESIGLAPYKEGIQFPNPDFAAFARACGGEGFSAKRPGELKDAISKALAYDGPAIVDAVVNPNELPNMPHIDISMMENYGLAKIKEAVGYITG